MKYQLKQQLLNIAAVVLCLVTPFSDARAESMTAEQALIDQYKIDLFDLQRATTAFLKETFNSELSLILIESDIKRVSSNLRAVALELKSLDASRYSSLYRDSLRLKWLALKVVSGAPVGQRKPKLSRFEFTKKNGQFRKLLRNLTVISSGFLG